MTTFINLFNKQVTLIQQDYTFIQLPACENPPVISFTEETNIIGGMTVITKVLNPINLPDVVEDTFYVVPPQLAFITRRPDFLVGVAEPGQTLSIGQPIFVKKLVR